MMEKVGGSIARERSPFIILMYSLCVYVYGIVLTAKRQKVKREMEEDES